MVERVDNVEEGGGDKCLWWRGWTYEEERRGVNAGDREGRQ